MKQEGTREAPEGLNDVPSIVLDTVGYMCGLLNVLNYPPSKTIKNAGLKNV